MYVNKMERLNTLSDLTPASEYFLSAKNQSIDSQTLHAIPLSQKVLSRASRRSESNLFTTRSKVDHCSIERRSKSDEQNLSKCVYNQGSRKRVLESKIKSLSPKNQPLDRGQCTRVSSTTIPHSAVKVRSVTYAKRLVQNRPIEICGLCVKRLTNDRPLPTDVQGF